MTRKTQDLFVADHARKDGALPEIVALSFFSGAMGLDIGMAQAGIHALLACEIDKYCRMTIETNNPDIALIGDINKYSAHDILQMAKIPEGRPVDVIFGGPPCQAFSTAGSRRGLDDERGNVFLKFLDIIGDIKPKYVVIENVRGLLSAAYPYGNSTKAVKGGVLLTILDKLKNFGYSVSFELYNAANFGAPQIRERLVIIAKLGDKVNYLEPTNSNNPKYNLPEWKSIRDAFETLNSQSPTYISFPERRIKFYRFLKEGQYWKDLPHDLQQEAMGNKLYLSGGKTGFFRRLAFDKPSPTLVTNPTMPATDLCHPTENRPLSTQEYACIQGFPNTWEICGPVLEVYKQIGNAVPIKLGEAIGRTIINDMKKTKNNVPKDFKYSRYNNTNDELWLKNIEKSLKQNKTDSELFTYLDTDE